MVSNRIQQFISTDDAGSLDADELVQTIILALNKQQSNLTINLHVNNNLQTTVYQVSDLGSLPSQQYFNALATSHQHRVSSVPMTDPQLQAWRDERRRFRALLPALLKDVRYRNRFVAINNGAVIGADTDKSVLARRISASHPGQIVFIGTVSHGIRRVEMPSPELQL